MSEWVGVRVRCARCVCGVQDECVCVCVCVQGECVCVLRKVCACAYSVKRWV